MRELGYYWVYGNKCFDLRNWQIYYWDGNYFCKGSEDFSEDCFEKINESRILEPDESGNITTDERDKIISLIDREIHNFNDVFDRTKKDYWKSKVKELEDIKTKMQNERTG